MVLIALAVIAPVAILTWPWSWLPDRLRYYSEFQEADRVIATIREYHAKHHRYPPAEEVPISAQAIEYIRLRDGFHLVLVAGFDEHFVYDSRRDAWERLGAVDEGAVLVDGKVDGSR